MLKNVISERNRRLQAAGVPKPGSLISQSPAERRIKYHLAREAGITPIKAAGLRELWSTHFFPQIKIPLPSKQERKEMGILHNPDIRENYSSYNQRRYSKPWIAKVTAWPIGQKPTLKWGVYEGDDTGGEVSIEASEGDIIRHGQKDYRGNNSNKEWYKVNSKNELDLITESEAHKIFISNSKNPINVFIGDVCRYCGAEIHGVWKPLIICPKCRRRQTTGAYVPASHDRDWKEKEFKEGEEMTKNPTVRYVPYPGGKNWMDKPLVGKEKTFKTEKQMQKFLDKLEKEGKLHEILGYSYDNPGAAWHQSNLSQALFSSSVPGIKKKTKHWFDSQAYSERVDRDESRKLGIPNPISKKGLGSLFVPAIIIGLIWWFSKPKTV